MSRSQYLIYCICSFILAIFVTEMMMSDSWWQVFSLLALCALYIRSKVLDVTAIGLIVLAFVFGHWHFERSFDLPDFDEGYVTLKGCIVDEVDVRFDKVKYVLEVQGLGRVLVNGPRYPIHEFGACLKVSGDLSRPEKIEDFDYDQYLARYDIYALMYRVKIEKLSKGDVSLMGELFWLKKIFETRLGEIFAEPHNSFMAGLILGSRSGIAAHLMEDFNTTGLTHIIAISGYNITLVIVFVASLFGFLSRKKKVFVSIIFIFAFVVLVGGSAAVVRAGIMGSISLLALWFGREYQVEIALLLAAFLMAIWNPKIIVYDLGFQLSFLATMGLIFVAPKIERWFLFLPKNFGIRESVLMTMSAQILALPVIIYNFGRLSLISPLANLFVLPFIPLVMMFGFMAVLFSFLWHGFAMFLAFVGYLFLETIILFVDFFARVPFASIDIKWFSWWMMLLYFYFVIDLTICRFNPMVENDVRNRFDK